MKLKLFVATVLLFSFGFASKATCQLSEKQKDQIKSEIKTVCDSIIAKYVGLDPKAGEQYYADSPDWVMFNDDASEFDFQTFEKFWNESIDSVKTIKWTTISQKFIFITQNDVICAWVGKDETLMKSGDKITVSPHAYTMIFKKISGNWKVVYSHDSGTPAIEKAEKK